MLVSEKVEITERVVYPPEDSKTYNMYVYTVWDDDTQTEYRVEVEWEDNGKVNEDAEISIYEDFSSRGYDGYVYDEELEKRIKDFIIQWENNQG
jgi:hypothetical protein